MLIAWIIISFVAGATAALTVWFRITKTHDAGVKFLHDMEIRHERLSYKVAILNYASANGIEMDLTEVQRFKDAFDDALQTNILIHKALASDQD